MKDNNDTYDTDNGESSESSGRIGSSSGNSSSSSRSSSKYKNSVGYSSTEVSGIPITAIAHRLGVDIILSETNQHIQILRYTMYVM